MTLPATRSTVDTSSAAWNAIATIKANSPFASASSTSSISDEFDSLIDHSAADALGGAAASPGSGSAGNAGSLALLREIQNAQQSTIDLFA